MKNFKTIFILTVISAGVLSSCKDASSPEAQRPADVSEMAAKNLKPTFDSIYQYVFARRCISCHSLGKPAHQVLLDRTSLLTSALDLVKPGNPDESGLVLAIERNDDKRKPTA